MFLRDRFMDLVDLVDKAHLPPQESGMHAAHTRRESAFSSANGYLAAGVGLVLLLGAAFLFLSGGVPATLGQVGAAALLVLAGLISLSGLYMLQPNEGAILDPVRQVHRHRPQRGPALGVTPVRQAPHLAARAQLQRADAEGQRQARQPDRDRRRRRLARARHGPGGVRRRRLRGVTCKIQTEAALRHLASQYAYDEGEDHGSETTLRAGLDDRRRRAEDASCRRASQRPASRCSTRS